MVQITEYGGRCSRPGASSKSSADMVYGYIPLVDYSCRVLCDAMGFDFWLLQIPGGWPKCKKNYGIKCRECWCRNN